jgi:LPS sulfotransferase NodH
MKFPSKYLNVLLGARLKHLMNLLPFFKHNTYTPFLILGHPRTGTSLLHTYLNSHNNILSLNEPLTHTNDGEALFKPYSKLITVVGFKYFHEYILDEAKKTSLINLASKHKIKVIKIDRKNYLRTYLSLCIAEKTNEWSSVGKSELGIIRKQISLTKDDCIAAFNNYKNIENETEKILNQYNIPVFQINYEDLVENSIAKMTEVQGFLGVEYQTPISLLKKQNPESLNELIINYNALKNEFIGTTYESFFEE